MDNIYIVLLFLEFQYFGENFKGMA